MLLENYYYFEENSSKISSPYGKVSVRQMTTMVSKAALLALETGSGRVFALHAEVPRFNFQ